MGSQKLCHGNLLSSLKRSRRANVRARRQRNYVLVEEWSLFGQELLQAIR
jgi:hypothetical protein